MTDRCVIWCPTRDAEQFAHDLSAPVLLPGMDQEKRLELMRRFRENDRGVLVVATACGVHGYRLAPAHPYFLDGCPEDPAWRMQARARCEDIATWQR